MSSPDITYYKKSRQVKVSESLTTESYTVAVYAEESDEHLEDSCLFFGILNIWQSRGNKNVLGASLRKDGVTEPISTAQINGPVPDDDDCCLLSDVLTYQPYQNKGLSTFVRSAISHVAVQVFKKDNIAGYIEEDNIPSLRARFFMPKIEPGNPTSQLVFTDVWGYKRSLYRDTRMYRVVSQMNKPSLVETQLDIYKKYASDYLPKDT